MNLHFSSQPHNKPSNSTYGCSELHIFRFLNAVNRMDKKGGWIDVSLLIKQGFQPLYTGFADGKRGTLFEMDFV